MKNTYNKYKNIKVKDGDYQFSSKAEYRRYQELLLLVIAGEITDLSVHPKFVLQEGFIYRGKKIRPIVYESDFMYQEDGETVVEDVKGGKATQTQLFKVKVKMLKYKYPELAFRIVEEGGV